MRAPRSAGGVLTPPLAKRMLCPVETPASGYRQLAAGHMVLVSSGFDSFEFDRSIGESRQAGMKCLARRPGRLPGAVLHSITLFPSSHWSELCPVAPGR